MDLLILNLPFAFKKLLDQTQRKHAKMKTFKGSIFLFLVTLAVGWIGFNVVNERFGQTASQVDASVNNESASDDSESSNESSASSNKSNSTKGDGDSATRPVKTMLDNRTDAWNNRDLARYMADFRKFDALRVSVDGERKEGWDAVRDFYVSKFGRRMGTLSLSNLDINMVGDSAAIASADWTLVREDTIANGRMNMVLKKINSAWKITTESVTQR
jgi:ketosteroid isomerase-like protein